MNLKILMVFTFMAACIAKKSKTATTPAGPKSCQDHISEDECVRDAECTTRYGEDAATAEEIYIACMPFRNPGGDCYGEKVCYTNSTGQRVIASSCDYPRWTQVDCTAAELAPCEYTTTAACEADQRCVLYTAKDLATKERIAIGCVYIRGACATAFGCYSNKLTGARAMASRLCNTFPEWENTNCTEADNQVSKELR